MDHKENESNDLEEFSSRALYLKKGDAMSRNDSCAESYYSTLGASTHGDCTSFEYSDYGEQSFNHSQSFMDETNGPALLAFVEDYILGQRLDMIETCDSEDDIASSSSSSYDSDTAFSADESVIKTIKSDINSNTLKNEESKNIEPLDQTSTKKSRWESLLQTISATKRKNPKPSICNSVEPIKPSQKKDESFPSRTRFLTTLKAKIVAKDAIRAPLETDNNIAVPSSNELSSNDEGAKIETITSVTTPEAYNVAINRLHQIREKAEKLGLVKKERISALLDISKSQSHIGGTITEDKSKETFCGGQVDKKPTAPTTSEIQSETSEEPKPTISTEMLHTNIYEEIEIPNTQLINTSFLQEPSTKNAVSEEKSNEQMFRSCDDSCCDDPSMIVPTTSTKFLRSTTIPRKPILCSRCRGALSEKSICSLLSKESFICQDVLEMVESRQKLNATQSKLSTLFTIHQEIEQELSESVSRTIDNTENIEIADNLRNLSHCPAEDEQESMNPIQDNENEIEVGTEIISTQKSSSTSISTDDPKGQVVEELQSVNDCPSNRIEATMTSPNEKAVEQSIQIEFKDWAGKDVEIVQDSPRKRRLQWIQDIISSTMMTPSHAEGIVPLELSGTIANENMNENQFEITEDTFPLAAVACNIETTASGNEKCSPRKSKYFGLMKQKTNVEHSKGVLLSPAALSKSFSEINDADPRSTMNDVYTDLNSDTIPENSRVVLSNSVLECVDDEVSLGNTECCLESTATSVTSRVVNKSSDGIKLDSARKPVEVNTEAPKELHDDLIRDTDEAYILERAMQQAHSEAKLDRTTSNIKKNISSPVTLYRFLDFDPCRTELAYENSYDMAYEPVGISICQLPKICNLTNKFVADEKADDIPLDTDSNSIISKDALHAQPSHGGSSFKKVFRRLKQPKVAFRDNLIDVYSKESEPKLKFEQSYESDVIPQPPILIYDAINPNNKSSNGSVKRITTDAKDGKMKDSSSKSGAKDKLNLLLQETKQKSTAKRIHSMEKAENASSQKSILSATRILSAIKTEYRAKREKNKSTSHSSRVSKGSINDGMSSSKAKASKARKVEMMKSRIHAAKILDEFKKAQATGKLRPDLLKNDNDIKALPTKEASDSTVVTNGTKLSTLSHGSKLTVEERKLAHRLMSDIHLLALIEKKRQAMGHMKSSLKSSDIDKSVQLLKSIEASRKSRSDLIKENNNKTGKNADTETKTNTAQLNISMLSDITSTKKVNN